MILLVLITFLSAFSNNYYKAFAEKHDGNDHDSIDNQHSSQKSDCKAGEDNNNSCNNISISRHGGDGDSDNSNKVQVSKQGSSCEAGEDNNNSCNNFDLQEMIKAKIDLLSQNRA